VSISADCCNSFAAKYASTCDAYSVDVEKDPKVVEYFGVTETPAAILYKDGEQVKKVQGKGAGMVRSCS
jgi:thioredoxin-like negative regulator of GroEL